MTPVREAIKEHKSKLDIAKDIVEHIPEEQKTEWKNMVQVIFTKGHKSKTILFGVLLIFFGFMQQALPQLANVIPPQYFGITTSIIGLIVMGLRYVTTKSLDEK
jgi:uncharacterized membrane protein HdeD (DUF308 family)